MLNKNALMTGSKPQTGYTHMMAPYKGEKCAGVFSDADGIEAGTIKPREFEGVKIWDMYFQNSKGTYYFIFSQSSEDELSALSYGDNTEKLIYFGFPEISTAFAYGESSAALYDDDSNTRLEAIYSYLNSIALENVDTDFFEEFVANTYIPVYIGYIAPPYYVE